MNSLLLSAAAAIFVANVASWKIEKMKDPMTDEISCTASIRGRSDVLLTYSVLYISTKIAPKGITIRLGEEPTRQSMVTSAEKTARAIMLGNFDIDRIIEQKISRVRYRVLTVLDTLVEGEIDVTGIDKAREIIRSEKCTS
jgi:hypothetical protein